MSSGVAPPAPPPISGPPARPAVDPESYIDRRLDEARRHVRGVDLTISLLKLSIGVLGYLLAVALADHWLVAEGLGRATRLALWAVLVLGAGWYAVRALLPPLLHRINPVYAAQTIEHARPSLKNALINFLLLRREREKLDEDDLGKRVYAGLQVQTANELTCVSVGTTVDRLQVIRLGYVLASLVAICCLYFVVSPKNPLASFGRVIFPWARIGVPTRVTIDNLQPGDTAAYQGDAVVVSAEVHGLRAGEPVTLYYSSEDGQSVDQAVPMAVPDGGYRHQGELPPGKLGLQQSLLYSIAAGDCTSPTFRIEMQIPPTITVDRIEYQYPEYTGLPRREALREGDIRAVEGTLVTIHATANYPIAHASIELDGDARKAIPMTASGTTASGQLRLAINPADPSQAQYRGYHLRFADADRRENRRPTRYRIEVIPDLKPEVRFDDPPPEELQLPVKSSVEIKVRAEDPDFGLRRVLLNAEREGRGLVIPPLLSKPRPAQPHQGTFQGAYRFEPARFGLKAGDKVVYWAEAADCKETEAEKGAAANVAQTEKRTILIVGDEPQQAPAKQVPEGAPQRQAQPQAGQKAPDEPRQDQQPGQEGPQEKEKPPGKEAQKEPPAGKPEQQPGQKPDSPQQGQPDGAGNQQGQPEGQDAAQPGEKPKEGQSPGGEKEGPGEKSEQPKGPVDGNTDPGEAMERILDHREEQQAEQPQKEQPKQAPGEQAKEGQGEQGKAPTQQEQQPGQPPPESDRGKQEKGAGTQAGSEAKKPGSEQQKAEGQSPTNQGEAPQEQPADQMPSSAQKGDPKKGGAGQQAPSDADSGMGQQTAEKPQQGADTKTAAGPKGGAGQNQPGQPSQSNDAQSAEGQQPAEKAGKPAGGEPGKATGKKPAEEKPQTDSAQAEAGSEKGTQGSPGAKPDAQSPRGESKKEAPAQKGAGMPEPAKAKRDERPGEPDTPKLEPSGAEPAASERSQQETKGAQAQRTGEEKQGQRAPEEKKPATGGEMEQRQEPAGAGRAGADKAALPKPQEETQPHAQKGQPPEEKKPGAQNEAQSPAISPKPSQTKGDQDGDRQGAGKSGGGQNANQQGQGTAGTQMPADQGGQTSGEKGQDEIGAKPGDQSRSDQATGESPAENKGPGSGTRQQPGGSEPGKQDQKSDAAPKAPEAPKPPSPTPDASAGKEPNKQGGTALGVSMGGGQPGQTAPGAPGAEPPPLPPDDPNLEYARKQTELALEHLADQLAKEDPELLKRLGWDKAYAEGFLRQWEQIKKAAAQSGPEGDKGKRELDKALKSLGLRPTPSRVRGAQAASDKLQQLQDPGRFAPPPEYIEQFRAYTQGVAGSKD